MKIAFFGTSEFALPALRTLIDSRHKVLAVVTQPDRRAHRSLKISPPPTKVLALADDIAVYQPQDASSRESAEYLKKFGADLFVAVSFGQILKIEVLALPKLCAINLHGSLLPKYRGAAPTNWAIINGEKESGITIIRMNEKMDEGDIILKKAVAIDPKDTNITLSEGLSQLGAQGLLEAIDMVEQNKAKFEKQDNSKATYAPKLKKADGLIDWSEPAVKIHDKVRGFLPWPGAYTHYNGKILKILETEPVDREDAGSLVMKTGGGFIAIKYVQLEGKSKMDIDSFLRGHRIPRGYHFNDQ